MQVRSAGRCRSFSCGGAVGALGVLGGCRATPTTAVHGRLGQRLERQPRQGGTGASGGSSSNGGPRRHLDRRAERRRGWRAADLQLGAEHTIQEITNGTIGPDIKVTIKGAVAMSHKWLVSGPGSAGSCLYGVFVSAPGLTTTAPNTGILVVSYGNEPVTNDEGDTFCAKVDGTEESGGNIPDDVKPGDVLDIPNAETTSFAPSTVAPCPTAPPSSSSSCRRTSAPARWSRTALRPSPSRPSSPRRTSPSSARRRTRHSTTSGAASSCAPPT